MDNFLPEDPMHLYITTTLSTKEISKLYGGRHGTNADYLNNRNWREGWVQKRKEYRAKVNEKLLEKGAEKSAQRVVTALQQLHSEAAESIENLKKVGAQLLSQRIKDGQYTGSVQDYERLAKTTTHLLRELRLHNHIDPNKPSDVDQTSDSEYEALLEELLEDERQRMQNM